MMSAHRALSSLYITHGILLLSEMRSMCNKIYFIFYLAKTEHLIAPVLLLSHSSAKFRSRDGSLLFAGLQFYDWKIVLGEEELPRESSARVSECNKLTSTSFKQFIENGNKNN